MHRENDTIIFSQSEQEEFSVSASLPVAIALETADGFSTAVETIAESQAFNVIDALKPEITARNNQANLRSARLSTFATGLYKQCSKELAERMLRELQGES